MKRLRQYWIFTAVFWQATTGLVLPLYAGGSSYSASGLGLMIPSMQARSVGMGRVAVAMPSGSWVNVYNPAALYGVRLFRVDAGLFYEGIVANTAQASTYSKWVNISYVHFAVPLGKRWAMSVGFQRLLNVDYAYRLEGQTYEGFAYTEQLKGTGGLQEVNWTTAYRLAPEWSLGFSARYAFGKTEKEWAVEWVSTDFVDTRDRREENRYGYRWSLGILQQNSRYHTGLYIASSHGFKTDYLLRRSIGDTSQNYQRRLGMPFEIGIGGVVHFSGYLLGADVIYYGWQSAKEGNRNYRNAFRMGLGVEKKPAEGLTMEFRETIAYRAGCYVQQLYARSATGHYASEYFITGGMGFPFNKNQHHLDVGFELGTRGSIASNKVRDTVIRLTLSVSSGERWFQQRRKKD